MPILYDDHGVSDKSGLDLDDSAIEIFLDPGEYFVDDDNFVVRTLLGSCVSITLQSISTALANHAILEHRLWYCRDDCARLA